MLPSSLPQNFWIPPAQGFTDVNRGLSLAQLAAIEARNGFALPATYRALMQLENGPRLRYTQCNDLLLENLIALSTTAQELVTLEDYMRLTCEPEQISDWRQSMPHCHLNRLLIFACEAHEVGCFDYGWQSEQAWAQPKIVFFSDNGDEFLHFKTIKETTSFDELLHQLSLTEFIAERSYLGIVSKSSFDVVCEQLRAAWVAELALQANDRSGWFNFDQWFKINVPLHLDDATLDAYAQANGAAADDMLEWVSSEGRVRRIACLLSPNQHRSGTHLYPDDPQVTAVLEIPKAWFPMQRPVDQLIAELRRLEGVEAVHRLLSDRG